MDVLKDVLKKILFLLVLTANSAWAAEKKKDSDELTHLLADAVGNEPFKEMLGQFSNSKTRRFAEKFLESLTEEKRAALHTHARALHQGQVVKSHKITSDGQKTPRGDAFPAEVVTFAEHLIANFAQHHQNVKTKSKRESTCGMFTTFALTVIATGAGSLTKAWCGK